MALGVLFISYAIILILIINVLFLLLIKSGIMAKNNVVFGIIVCFILVLSFIIWSSLPYNYFLKRLIVSSTGILIILSIYFKKNNFNISRVLIIVSILINVYFMIF